MNENITFSKHDEYLLTSIADTVITVERAKEILARIGTECLNLKCNKVLLDERSVEKREVPPRMKLSKDMERQELSKIYMASWCQPQLINKDSCLLSLFTYKNKYVVQHFSGIEEAVTWLHNQYIN